LKFDFGLIVPMANEEKDFLPFITSLRDVLNKLDCGKVYIIVDNVSKDRTLALCKDLSLADSRFITVWAPENKNVVDAYIRGYKEAIKYNHKMIIEMDAGLSHDPVVLPVFLKNLSEGKDCVFGSRFIEGGSLCETSWKRHFLSRIGTILSNLLLGSKLYDMTSGYQGFQADIVEKFVKYNFLSKAHFYQTELRYLLRKTRYIEIPITYRAPSPGVSMKSIINSIRVLLHYFNLRLRFSSPFIK
jgi:dolichol-phosphate mannosyltransferase